MANQRGAMWQKLGKRVVLGAALRSNLRQALHAF